MAMSVNARTLLMVAAAAAGLSGCAVTLKGLVEEHRGPGVQLKTSEGKVYRLVTVGEGAPVAHLEGHLVELDGRRVFRTLTVEGWRVAEGLHGLQAWVGELRWMGAQLGLDDRNSGAFYYLDDDAGAALGPHVDKPVLVEGYVVGPNRVKVLYYRVLQ